MNAFDSDTGNSIWIIKHDSDSGNSTLFLKNVQIEKVLFLCTQIKWGKSDQMSINNRDRIKGRKLWLVFETTSKIQIVGVLNPSQWFKSCCWNQAALQGGWSHVLCCSEAIKSVEDWLFRACKDKMQSQPACMKLNQIWAAEVVQSGFHGNSAQVQYG